MSQQAESRVDLPDLKNAPKPLVAHRPTLSAHRSVTAALAALVVLLTALAWSVGLSRTGWIVGLACGAGLCSLVVRAVARDGAESLGPADLVTLSRAVMACGLAALTVELWSGRPVTLALVGLTVPALVLDAVDGHVARRTGTATAFGAAFDGEVDAFLILVLSVAVASRLGWWVLAAGLARYVFAVGGWLLPWMRGTLEYRYWRKVVTAVVGVVLAVVVSGVLPAAAATVVVVGALALLAESFGRDVWWLWRRRHLRSAATSRQGGGRASVRIVGTVLAVLLVWFALLAPHEPERLTPLAFARIPFEPLLLVGIALLVSTTSERMARSVALIGGGLLGVLAVLKILDLGSFAVLDRPFNVVTDRALLGSGLDFLSDSMGPWAARGALVGAVVVAVVVLSGAPLAVSHLTGLLTARRRTAARTATALAALWVVLAVTGLQLAPGVPLAAAESGPFAAEKVGAAADAVRDQRQFLSAIEDDSFREASRGELSGLRGKDVVFAFVESYGRVAVEHPDSAPVRAVLDAGTDELGAAGFEARSAFLTSPTFGGSSWLAHASVMSGLWVDDQQRYDRLLTSGRTTLTSVFVRSGWRTVAVLPSNNGPWPEGQGFYGFEEVYDRSNLGYAGPRFGFSAMPDQFALAELDRRELRADGGPPVMAEVALTSSHGPWAPLPTRVDPAELGDGSVFHDIHAEAVTAASLWSDRGQVPTAYRTSIRYSIGSVLDFIGDYRGARGLVVVLLGDHQPATIVSGFGENRDVPVTVIADDPTVLDQIEDWGWHPGLRPGGDAPVWPMDDFRDRFLTAFGGPEASATVEGQHAKHDEVRR